AAGCAPLARSGLELARPLAPGHPAVAAPLPSGDQLDTLGIGRHPARPGPGTGFAPAVPHVRFADRLPAGDGALPAPGGTRAQPRLLDDRGVPGGASGT